MSARSASARRLSPAARRSLAAMACGTALTLALGACSSDDKSGEGKGDGRPELKISGAYVPQPPTKEMAGGFLTVRNGGEQADKLTSVSSDVAGKVEMHKTVEQQMERVKSLRVPAHGTLELGRGGNHLMLMELKHKPTKGQTVTFVLHFQRSGAVTVKAPVEAANYTPRK
ncbi:copper chaperone PCu(A)C [Streptomyces sp. 891-h]|uniref:copper chaperone PCu(A)C n=1 Tax=Streptomyces sp. 891-h TaxID=2720714 RepID=UPI001FAAE66F|nr:copper chaperone PCu(A)C [Streptomyces sp. 891-h]